MQVHCQLANAEKRGAVAGLTCTTPHLIAHTRDLVQMHPIIHTLVQEQLEVFQGITGT